MTVTLTFYTDSNCKTKVQESTGIPERYIVQNFENNVCTNNIFVVVGTDAGPGWARYNCTNGALSVGTTKTNCINGTEFTDVIKKDTCISAGDGYYKFECSSEPDLTGGDITGIVVGSVAGLILLGYIYYRYYRKGKSTKFTKSKKGNKK